eukprot:531015-Hanusia_phi.AAC.1
MRAEESEEQEEGGREEEKKKGEGSEEEAWEKAREGRTCELKACVQSYPGPRARAGRDFCGHAGKEPSSIPPSSPFLRRAARCRSVCLKRAGPERMWWMRRKEEGGSARGGSARGGSARGGGPRNEEVGGNTRCQRRSRW